MTEGYIKEKEGTHYTIVKTGTYEDWQRGQRTNLVNEIIKHRTIEHCVT